MSNELALVNVEDAAAREAALAALGMGHLMGGGDSLPRLRINKHFEDADGNSLPPKTWTLDHPEHGTIFGRPAVVRVFVQAWQYQHYDADLEWEDAEGNKRKGKEVNRSVIVTDRKTQEMYDEQGTVRCGKQRYSKEEYATLTDAQKKANSSRKPVTQVFGLIRFDEAVTQDGTQLTDVGFTPFRWEALGTNRDTFHTPLQTIVRKKYLPMEVEISLELERQQNGDLVWYTADPTINFAKTHPLTADDQKLAQSFLHWIANHNERVREKYLAALKGGMPEEDEELANSFEDGYTDPDFDDEVPF